MAFQDVINVEGCGSIPDGQPAVSHCPALGCVLAISLQSFSVECLEVGVVVGVHRGVR